MDDSVNFIKHFVDKASELQNISKESKDSKESKEPKVDLPGPNPEEVKQMKEEREERMTILPPIIPGNDFPPKYDIKPAEYLVDGFIQKNDLALLSAPSKTGKSWIWNNIAMACAAGIPIFNRETRKSKVLLIDFELRKDRIQERLIDIALARGLDGVPDDLHLWSLSRVTYDLELIIESLKVELLDKEPYDLIVVDPLYCIDTKDSSFDENSSRHVTSLFQELENLVCESDAALGVCHHFRKGNPNSSDAQDRSSGSGAFARYPSLLLSATRHEEEDCLIIESTARNQKSPDPFVVQLEAPLILSRPDLDPSKFRRYGSRGKPRFDPSSVIMGHVPEKGKIGRNRLFFLCSKDGVDEQHFNEGVNLLLEKDLCFTEEGDDPSETVYYYR